MSIVEVLDSIGFTFSMEASLPDMYELPAPESISARHVIPFTLTTTTGKIPSAVLPLAVNVEYGTPVH
jgi:hypothetical protein